MRRKPRFDTIHAIKPQDSVYAVQSLGRKVRALAVLTALAMKRTSAYIDGYNLYYGLLKGTPYKWLDPVRFVSSLLRDGHELLAVKYFTSPVKTYPYDTAALDRQKVYLQALSTLPRVEIIQGFYRKDAVLMPAHEEECRSCPIAKDGFVKVIKLEEKRTDVNIASAMLLDAFNDKADVFVLVSGDTDFIAPVNIVRKDFKKTVLVFNPRDSKSWLRDYASYYRDIPRDLPAQCQLPDTIPYGKRGDRFIHRPAAWMPLPQTTC